MGLLDRLRTRKASSTLPPPPPAAPARPRIVLAEADEWDRPDDPGQEDLWGRGFHLHDADGIGYSWDDPVLDEHGIVVVPVAGVTHHDGLQRPFFAPGCRARLIPEPTNPYDRNAVGVWDRDGTVQLGYVPRESAAEIARRLSSGERFDVVCLWEWFTKADQRRVGVRLLIAPERLIGNMPT